MTMTLWLLNSAVLPSGEYGTYEFSASSWDALSEAITLAGPEGIISRIGYPETAELIRRHTGYSPAISRETSSLRGVSVAYIVRLRYRVDPARKGAPVPSGDGDWEVATLRRLPETEDVPAVVTGATYTLPRTGNVPLTVRGERVADAEGRWFAGREQTRWHEVAVYRTLAGRWVLAITLVTQWQGEVDQREVRVCDSREAVVEALRAHDPTERYQSRVAGYSPGERWDDRQARLVDSLRERWAALRGGVLEQLGVTEEVD